MYVGLILDFVEEFSSVPQGEFMSRAHPTEAPFSPPPLPGVSETDRMTYFWLSEYMANTASYVYQKAGAFKHTLTPENVKVGPTGVCYRVYTACTVSAVCTYNAYIQLNLWRGHLYVIADCAPINSGQMKMKVNSLKLNVCLLFHFCKAINWRQFVFGFVIVYQVS